MDNKKLISPIRRLKPGEEIKYLLLIKVPNSDETFWEVIQGREDAYNYIKDNIDVIDVTESYIVSNNIKIDFDNMHTIYDFIKFVKEANDIVDEFDIDDWKPNIDSSQNIGIGLETGGNVFTGIVDSFESVYDDENND